ncbi:MAG: M12 family metallo-peptidase [Saprospiraceae bacterium]
MLKKTKSILVVLAIVLASQSNSFGQGVFMASSNINPSTLTNAEQQRLQAIQNSPNTGTVQLMNMGILANIVDENGNFTFNVPGHSGNFTAQASLVEAESGADFTWLGDIYNSVADLAGSMVLYGQNGEISGTIDLMGDFYEIVALNQGLSILSKIEPDLTLQECNTQGFLTDDDPPAAGDRSDNCVVRVLVFYTPSVIVDNFDVNSLANTAIAQINQALINSGISQQDLKVRLASVLPNPPSFTFTGDEDTDLDAFRTNGDVLNLRGLHFADMVVMLFNGGYSVAGQAERLGPSNSGAFAIVSRNNATATMTFAHEVGHMFGCHHQQCDLTQTAECIPAPAVGYNHGYKFTDPVTSGDKSTIMHVLTSSIDRQMRYSNPNISQSGVPTGVTNNNDNARVIDENGCTVANFEESPLIAGIYGQNWGEPNEVVSLSSSTNGGTLPYQYEWKMGVNPMNYNISLGNSASASFTVAFPKHYIRLKVTSSDGQVSYAYHIVTQANPKPTNSDVPADLILNEKSSSIQSIAPNPSNGTAIVTIKLDSPTQVKIDVLNSLGESIILVQEADLKKGWHSFSLDTSQFPAGNYYLRLQDQNVTLVEQFLYQDKFGSPYSGKIHITHILQNNH